MRHMLASFPGGRVVIRCTTGLAEGIQPSDVNRSYGNADIRNQLYGEIELELPWINKMTGLGNSWI